MNARTGERLYFLVVGCCLAVSSWKGRNVVSFYLPKAIITVGGKSSYNTAISGEHCLHFAIMKGIIGNRILYCTSDIMHYASNNTI